MDDKKVINVTLDLSLPRWKGMDLVWIVQTFIEEQARLLKFADLGDDNTMNIIAIGKLR
jgi:hypothetical protein